MLDLKEIFLFLKLTIIKKKKNDNFLFALEKLSYF